MNITVIMFLALGFLALLASCEGCRAVLDQRQYYTQFDAMEFNDILKLPGRGTYLFSERISATNPECNFRVELDNAFSTDSLPSASSITIKFNSDVIYLGQNGILKINGRQTNVPYKGYYYTLTFSQNFFTVQTLCKDKISFDGHHEVVVETIRESGDELRGLCGNYNGQKDDCVSKNGDGLLIQNGRCPSFVFGLGFLLANKNERICIDLDATPFELSKNYSDIAMGLDLCGNLDLTRNDSLFRQYLDNEEAVANVELFTAVKTLTRTMLDVCLYDVGRSLETGLDPMEGACDVISAYVNGVLSELAVNMPLWRKDCLCAPKCNENEYFDDNNKGCEATCLSEICVKQKTSGCRCKPGYKRSHTYCVPDHSCGCDYNGEYVQAGESRDDTSNCQVFRCQMDESSGHFNMIKQRARPKVVRCKINEGSKEVQYNTVSSSEEKGGRIWNMLHNGPKRPL